MVMLVSPHAVSFQQQTEPNPSWPANTSGLSRCFAVRTVLGLLCSHWIHLHYYLRLRVHLQQYLLSRLLLHPRVHLTFKRLARPEATAAFITSASQENPPTSRLVYRAWVSSHPVKNPRLECLKMGQFSKEKQESLAR